MTGFYFYLEQRYLQTCCFLVFSDQHHFGKKNINKCIEVYKDSWSGIFIRCCKIQFRAHLQMQDFLAEVMHQARDLLASVSALRRHSLHLDNGGRVGKGGHGQPEKETTWIMQLMKKQSLFFVFLFFTSLAGRGGTQVLIKHSFFIQLH